MNALFNACIYEFIINQEHPCLDNEFVVNPKRQF
jgi:hypothetical protein